jgi:arginase
LSSGDQSFVIDKQNRALSIIGAPSSAGAYAPGQEKAPAAFRRHGLADALSHSGRKVTDRGDVAGFRWRPDPTRAKAMNLDAVAACAQTVAGKVAAALADDEAVLVLGGDCTVELGTVAGALSDAATIGLVYIDLDADLNTPATSDGALDWTGAAHLLDLPGAAAELASLGSRRPMLPSDSLLFFGAEEITPVEARMMERLDLSLIRLAEVKADPGGAAARAVRWASRFDRLLVHLDVDVLDFIDFPIAENVRRLPGLTLAELTAALGVLLAAPNWRALTMTEVNPDHAPGEAAAFGRLNAMLSAALPA